jgi:hypothetical protein
VHDVAWPHPCPLAGIVIIPLLDAVPPPELLEPPELLAVPREPELLAVPPLEPELVDVAPELLPLRVPVPLLLVPPPLLPLPLAPPVGWPLFIMGLEAPLEVPLVSTGVVVPPALGVDDVQPKIETATVAAVARLIEWMFFISASRTVGLLDDGNHRGPRLRPAKAQKRGAI